MTALRPAVGRREVVVTKHVARMQRDQERLREIREQEIPSIISKIRLLGSRKKEEDEAERQRLLTAEAILQREEKQLEESLSQTELPCGSSDKVALGSTVTFVILETGVEHTVTLVASNGKPKEDGTITAETPVAKALTGARVGQVVKVSAPRDKCLKLRVTDICSG